MKAQARHPRRTRPPVKQDAIVAFLRRRIIDQALPPGSRLPSHSELRKRFATTPVTVQRALKRLIHDGFAVSERRRGTFVAAAPPHLRRVALAFAGGREEVGRSRFWTVLAQEARSMRDAGEIEFDVYAGVDSLRAQDRGYQRLLADVLAHRLAGIVFAHDPFTVAGSPILTEPGIPRVAVMPRPAFGAVPIRLASQDAFLTRSVEHLRERGRLRIAVLCSPGEEWRSFPARIAKMGMDCRPHWVHVGALQAPEPLENVTRALARLPRADRPDGLVIMDDNYVNAACGGLRAEGMRIPGDIDVVAHCNFPWPDDGFGTARLGYDIRALLSAAAEIIMKQRRRKRAPRSARMPLLFEWELG